MILDRNVSGSDLKNLSPSNFRLQFEPFQLPKSWQAHSNLYINIPNVPNSLLLVTVSVTLTDVWCCSPIVRVRVVLRRTVIDWQKFFHRPIWWPPPDLSKRWTMVPKTILRRTTLTRTMKLHSTASLVMLWCHWSRERKQISGISFSTRNEKFPLPALLFTQPPPLLGSQFM